MATLQTLFRAVVMLATLGLVAKAWYHYGPSVGELETIGSRVVEFAGDAAARYLKSPGSGSPLAADTPPPAPFVPQGGPVQRLPRVAPAATPPSTDYPVLLAGDATVAPAPVPQQPVPNHWPSTTLLSAVVDPAPHDPVETMRERLRQMGVVGQELMPWGSRGEVVRFTCSVPWANSSHYTRHFEAVAGTPLEAVRQVTSEIEAWRAAEGLQ